MQPPSGDAASVATGDAACEAAGLRRAAAVAGGEAAVVEPQATVAAEEP
jgi:hypothetical protein